MVIGLLLLLAIGLVLATAAAILRPKPMDWLMARCGFLNAVAALVFALMTVDKKNSSFVALSILYAILFLACVFTYHIRLRDEGLSQETPPDG